MKISTRLEDLMWENRIKSINQLSELTGITRNTLTKLKNNDSKGVNFETIETLCKFFNCSINDLFQLEREGA
jgi:putative transcriptional regulator